MIDQSKSELRTRSVSAKRPSDVDVTYTTCCHSAGTFARVDFLSVYVCVCGCAALLVGYCDSAQGREQKHDCSDFPLLNEGSAFKISPKSSGILPPCYTPSRWPQLCYY